MARTTTVRARIEPSLKDEVETVLDALGLSTTEAITLFYKQIQPRQGLPFAVEVPNKTTQRTFDATDRGEGLNSHDTVEGMFASLDKC
jgi:DNA-damage-inducible protein J